MKKNNIFINGKYYSVNKACEMYGIKRSRVYDFIRFGKMNPITALLIATKETYKFDPLMSREELKEISAETIEENIIIVDKICSKFGCPNVLSRTEKLCGSKCLKHQ